MGPRRCYGPRPALEGSERYEMHAEEPTSCESCNASFPTAAALEDHRATAHSSSSMASSLNPEPRELTSSGSQAQELPGATALKPTPAPSAIGSGGTPASSRSVTAAAQKGPTEDPVADRSGRAPTLPGKQAPPTGTTTVPTPPGESTP
jgi:hypothetical protein